MSKVKYERREFDKSIPCFHCSRSLQQLSRHNRRPDGVLPYVGFVVVDGGYERVFHLRCLDYYFDPKYDWMNSLA